MQQWIDRLERLPEPPGAPDRPARGAGHRSAGRKPDRADNRPRPTRDSLSPSDRPGPPPSGLSVSPSGQSPSSSCQRQSPEGPELVARSTTGTRPPAAPGRRKRRRGDRRRTPGRKGRHGGGAIGRDFASPGESQNPPRASAAHDRGAPVRDLGRPSRVPLDCQHGHQRPRAASPAARLAMKSLRAADGGPESPGCDHQSEGRTCEQSKGSGRGRAGFGVQGSGFRVRSKLQPSPRSQAPA